MFYSDFFQVGSVVEIPELASCTPDEEKWFLVASVHRGGMGECIHLQTISSKQHYALKRVLPDLVGDNDAINQFHNELGLWVTASACDAVVEAIAVIRLNEVPSVFQQWMSGGDLLRALPNMRVEHRIQALLRIVRGLNWVYSNLGVIHCDLKPANILLDENGISYIADWGLARPIRKAMNEVFHGTLDKRVMQAQQRLTDRFTGTILYSAPESILNPKSIDHRTDIYALGCIMYEMETGSPPFVGSSFLEIARKHVEEKPPKLGGLLHKTATGLEKIIEKCMQKIPSNRYATYTELEEDILQLSIKRNFSIINCNVAKRYDRYQLGAGYIVQRDIMEIKAKQSNNEDYVLLENEQIEPFINEAHNLIAVERYEEASRLLQPHFIPSLLDKPSEWYYAHTMAEAYAYSLSHLCERQKDAIEIYEKLNIMKDKPAEFFVNYSYVLLVSRRFNEAIATCNAGLVYYPNDIDIIGNQTIAFRNTGDLDNAEQSAKRRLSIRRDVHSIEEITSVISSRLTQFRDSDLPKAIELAKIQTCLISEGLELNPKFATLRTAELQSCCFAEYMELAFRKYKEIENEPSINSAFKQLAFVILIDYFSNREHYKMALELIEKYKKVITSEVPKRNLEYIKLKIYADRYMLIDYRAPTRKIIKEVNEFFLNTENGVYQYPVMTARILEWIGEVEEAEKLLLCVVDSWEAKKHLAMMKQRIGEKSESYSWAERLVKSAPWRAESYDVFSYIASLEGDNVTQSKMKEQGDNVFKKEKVLFESLRAELDHNFT